MLELELELFDEKVAGATGVKSEASTGVEGIVAITGAVFGTWS